MFSACRAVWENGPMTLMSIPVAVALVAAAVLFVAIVVALVLGMATGRVRIAGFRGHSSADEGDDLPDETATLLSMMPGVSIVVDANDEVVRSSPDAYRLGVVADDAIVDQTVLDAVHEARRSGGKRLFDLTTTTPQRYVAEVNRAEHVESRTSSRPNWLKVTVGRIDDRFVIVLVNDVSDAIRFAQVRDAFIINVSEQLLGPTEALGKLADELEKGELDAQQIARDARQVRSSCDKLNHMVSDLLLLIRAQEPITPSSANRLPLLDQVRETVERLRPQADRFGVGLTVSGDADLVVNDEGGQIDSAVTKLVENAIGYSPEGGVVGVSVTRSKGGDSAVIRVIDHGAGIDKKAQSRIFERFYRGADQNARTADGVGLGLAIAKHVALTHHGDITVWSAPGQGSTFSLTLPLAQ